MINIQTAAYCSFFVVLADNQIFTGNIILSFNLWRIEYNVICTAGSKVNTTTAHTLNDFFIRYADFNNSINTDVISVKSFSLRDSTRETVKKETKTFQVASFEGLEVSWIFQVELSQASQQKVVVEAPDFLMPYLKVKVRDNKLILGVDNLPGNIRRRVEKENHAVRAIVAMPELSDLEMSGASKVVATGDFQTTHFEMELSGASSLKGLKMSARDADLECSGASKFQMSGKVNTLEMDLSGASKGSWEGDASLADLDLSGSAKLDMSGAFDNLKAEVSAASNLQARGSLKTLHLSCSGAAKADSGAAKADLVECPTKDLWVVLSGASSARVNALETLSAHVSGASKCQYKAGEKLQITEMDVDRAASLKKL